MSQPLVPTRELPLPMNQAIAPNPHPEKGPSLIRALARVTRRFHPKGTDRLFRLVHPPGNSTPVRTIVDYDDGLKMHVDTHSFCEWYIFFYGAYRPRVSELLNRMLKPGDVAFDIGANIGMHSVIMANRVGPTGRVVSFEPDPHPHARLRANLALNGLDFVDTRRAALSNKSGKTTFYLHDDSIGNYANASLHAENVGKSTRTVEVDLYSLDDFIAQNPVPRLDVIKLLAQGEEWNVLQGALRTIERCRPSIFFLYEPSYWQRQGRQLMDAVTFFKGYGYTTYAIEFGPRRAVTGEIDMGQVFLATPHPLPA
jgi:FkbM family methyltransferase